MINSVMKIEKFEFDRSMIDLQVSFSPEKEIANPRVSVIFTCDGDARQVPMTTGIADGKIIAAGRYTAAYIFYKHVPQSIKISFVLSDGVELQKYDTDLTVRNIKKTGLSHFFKLNNREKLKIMVECILNLIAAPFRMMKINQNRISFFTNRTSVPTGNLKAVYDSLKDMHGLDVNMVCQSGGAKGTVKVLFRFLKLYMTSRVVFVDDYYHLLSFVKKKKGTKLIQLWHGCGAFKTVGFSRYHKDSRLDLSSSNHRQYDYAIVSSPEITSFYGEAFGIDEKKVLPLGCPRCDILTDAEYQKRVRNNFFERYPDLQGKKLLLFAPTFRGNGNGDCYYPTERFDVDKMLRILGDDWAVIIKMHPYNTEKFTCSAANRKRMVDCYDWDVNDILIVSDFLITDYSSVIFEAALLEKPMALLAYDIDTFIAGRDFYYDFNSFVPAPVFETDEETAQYIKANQYDMDKIAQFKQRAFGSTMGSATENIKNLTLNLINQTER